MTVEVAAVDEVRLVGAVVVGCLWGRTLAEAGAAAEEREGVGAAMVVGAGRLERVELAELAGEWVDDRVRAVVSRGCERVRSMTSASVVGW